MVTFGSTSFDVPVRFGLSVPPPAPPLPLQWNVDTDKRSAEPALAALLNTAVGIAGDEVVAELFAAFGGGGGTNTGSASIPTGTLTETAVPAPAKDVDLLVVLRTVGGRNVVDRFRRLEAVGAVKSSYLRQRKTGAESK